MSELLDPSLAALRQLNVAQLQARYADLFGEPTRTGNKTWLIKRIAWSNSAQTRTWLPPDSTARSMRVSSAVNWRSSSSGLN
jgi:hypothetical protein